MLRQRLERYAENPYQSTPRSSHRSKLKTEEPVLSESKLAVIGLIVSLLVIAGKLLVAYQDDIKEYVLDRRLFTTELINEDGNLMYHHVWKNVVKFSNVWLPLLCGALTTYFTWVMVYLDSNVPGVQPPSPLSPSKYKLRSGHSFHLNYVFALVMGISVAIYLYWRDVNIKF